VALRAAGVALPPTVRQLPANVPDVVRRRFSSADSCLRSNRRRSVKAGPPAGQPELPSGASSGRSGTRVADREALPISLDRDVAVRKIVGAGLSEKFPDHLFLVPVVAFAKMVVA
jgi:hypothetical protein